MFSRLLFLLLLAANLGVAVWLWLAPRPLAAAAPVSDAGVARLILLSELGDTLANTAELATPPLSPSDLRQLSCTRLGPFPSQADLRRALTVLTPLTERIQFRETRTSKSRGFWVYLPAFGTRDQALSKARELSAKGIRDYYVVTAGDQQNTISLGLFRDRSNADSRRSELVLLGFQAQMRERRDDAPEYWLEYAIRPEQSFDWRDRVPDVGDLRAEPTLCG
ncbi:MAG: SPOR domain-containing protein [Lysobacterales bacterium]